MCIATPISVNTFLIDVSYSQATFSLEMLGLEHAIEDREITSRSRWVCWLKSTLVISLSSIACSDPNISSEKVAPQ